MKKIKNLHDLALLLNTRVSERVEIRGFSVDSRLIQPKEAYIALKGMNADGHSFIEEAAAKGASCIIAEKKISGITCPTFIVENTVKTLQEIAANLLIKRSATIVGITGSVGKTSTKEFLYTLLKDHCRVGKSLGNQNSQIGLPLTILNNTDGEEDVLLLEMGMSEPGNISKLVQIAPPHIALITQIALVHAENFTSLHRIAQAKSEIFSHEKTKIKIAPSEWKIGTLGFSLENSKAEFFLDSDFHYYEKGSYLGKLPIMLPGKHMCHNILAAMAVARSLNMEFENLQEKVSGLTLSSKRFELKEKHGILFIDDTYNASAISIKAALNAMPKPKKGRFAIAVLGEMLELGNFSKQCHIDVAEEALKKVDYLFCYGLGCLPMLDVWQKSNKNAFYFDDRTSLLQELRNYAKEGDVVLVKGSQAKQMWKIIDEF